MKPLNIEMSDPLTLGLKLGMGHPVTERIRRLSMRKTNLLTRSGTCALIVAALGLTAPVFTATAANPVTEAVETVTKKAVESLDEMVPMPTLPEDKTKIKKTAEASVQAVPQNGLKPMRLRMIPRFTPDQMTQIKATHKAFSYEDRTSSEYIHLDRLQVTVDNQGNAYLEISNTQGGWPGFPVGNVNWEKRPLSADMKRGMNQMMSRCASTKSPFYFLANLSIGDADIQKGTFEVECVAGAKTSRNSVTAMDLAKAYLISDELPLSRRQGNFDWKMSFAMMEDYVVKTPNATIAGDRKECVRILTYLKTNYDFIAANSRGIDSLESKCPTSDYNWMRRRMGVPEIQ